VSITANGVLTWPGGALIQALTLYKGGFARFRRRGPVAGTTTSLVVPRDSLSVDSGRARPVGWGLFDNTLDEDLEVELTL
jgi:hypothetical protein